MITAKELANRLGLSQTAVSMALNNKPGVSDETRKTVLEAAERYGYDFSRLALKNAESLNIYYISYRVHNAVMYYSPIEADLISGMEEECREFGYRLRIMNVSKKDPDLRNRIEELRTLQCAGIIVLGTEMEQADSEFFLGFSFPTVLLDTDFVTQGCIGVTIDNVQGAYLATDYLLSRHDGNPGYLASSYPIENFKRRRMGFESAVKKYGKAVVNCIRHDLTPSIDGAMAEMMEIIDSGATLARAYFAENDFLAIGAMKAFKAKGYRIPEDVAFIGFDDIREDKICEPALSSVNVPFHFMGRMAVRSFNHLVKGGFPFTYKITVTTTLSERQSV